MISRDQNQMLIIAELAASIKGAAHHSAEFVVGSCRAENAPVPKSRNVNSITVLQAKSREAVMLVMLCQGSSPFENVKAIFPKHEINLVYYFRSLHIGLMAYTVLVTGVRPMTSHQRV